MESKLAEREGNLLEAKLAEREARLSNAGTALDGIGKPAQSNHGEPILQAHGEWARLEEIKLMVAPPGWAAT